MEEIVNFTIVFCINLNTYEFKRTVQLQPIELTSVSIKNQGILYSQSKFLWCTLLISHKHTQFDRYEDFTYDARLIFISPDWFRWPLQKKDSNAIWKVILIVRKKKKCDKILNNYNCSWKNVHFEKYNVHTEFCKLTIRKKVAFRWYKKRIPKIWLNTLM